MTNTVIALDTETHLIGPNAIAPKVVCATMAGRGADGQIEVKLVTNGDGEAPYADLRAYLEGLFSGSYKIVGQFIAYDLGCIVGTLPDLHPLIWKALDLQRITDVRIREKLLNLSSHGSIDYVTAADGKKFPIQYDLATMVKNRVGYDRSKVKQGEDIWRLRFGELDFLKAEDYPPEAAQYAMDDASDTLEVYEAQERDETSPKGGPGSMRTQAFHTACDFALFLMTIRGIRTDKAKVQEAMDRLNKDLHPDELPKLVHSGILVPAKKGEPYKNNPNRFKKDQPEKINTKALRSVIEQVCKKNKIPVKTTKKGATATDAAFIEEIAHLDPRLEEYQIRQKLNRLRTTELPKMMEGIVHPNYAVLKETGRTSSFGGDLYPSCNIQQADPRTRFCYIPREGFVFCSTDYSSIELVSLAQKTYKLFGYSVHRDLINDGVDLHAYLGAQLCYHFSDSFRAKCDSDDTCRSPLDTYNKFLDLKTTDHAFFKKFRTFAKPVGLGFPGGLGAETFTIFAKATYGITVSLEMAERMKEIWMQTYPEMQAYFDWINSSCMDPKNHGDFSYFSPLGMYRAGATYCACSNGAGLQTPTSEGAKGALFQVSRRCYDPSMNSILYKSAFPVMFIHDEIIIELLEDDLMHERAMLVSKIMNEAMQKIMPDVKVSSEPALMRWWDKEAEPVYDERGRLTIWTPDDEEVPKEIQ